MDIHAGTSAFVTHDIVIENQYAFRRGEEVVVEGTSPNPQRPEFKYVVVSRTLQKRFQLCDADLAFVQQQVLSVPQQPLSTEHRSGPHPLDKAKRISKRVFVLCVGTVVLLGIVITALVLFLGNGSYKSEATKVLKALERVNALAPDTVLSSEELGITVSGIDNEQFLRDWKALESTYKDFAEGLDAEQKHYGSSQNIQSAYTTLAIVAENVGFEARQEWVDRHSKYPMDELERIVRYSTVKIPIKEPASKYIDAAYKNLQKGT